MMSSPSHPRSGRRARLEPLLLLAALPLTWTCHYGFQGGGGFPSHIHTLYIQPLENQTAQFELEQLLFARLLERVPRALGVRPAGRELADAVLTGRIMRYDDVAQSYRAGDPSGQATVVAHQVQIAMEVQIIDARQNVILWEASNLTGRGEYQPATQSNQDGRSKAIDHLVQQIVDGAQSQW